MAAAAPFTRLARGQHRQLLCTTTSCRSPTFVPHVINRGGELELQHYKGQLLQKGSKHSPPHHQLACALAMFQACFPLAL